VQEHWPAVPVTRTPANTKPLDSDVTSMTRAAALSVSLPLIGHESVESAESVMLRYETSVGWITVPVKGLLKLIMNPSQSPDDQQHE
jgi:hypothetical protein